MEGAVTPIPSSERGRAWLLPLLLVPVSLLADLGAALPLRTYFFRDFSLFYYPLRVWEASAFSGGRWAFWNPYIHEGTYALPAFYPLDLLHSLWPGPAAVSWLLTAHFPLAALGAYWLAREVGTGRLGAFLSGAVYALGGIAVSSLNLYVYLQALAWTPFVVAASTRAARLGGRTVAQAAVVVAVMLSTLVAEFVAQAVLLGLALGAATLPRPRALARMGAGIVLGLGLAALPVAVTLGVLSESVRVTGFGGNALDWAVPPVALVQALVPRVFGWASEPFERWWGGRLFTDGLPYLISLYLGPVVLALAAVGARAMEPRKRWVLLGLGALGLWVALGETGGLAPVVAGWPVVRWFRFPSKALLLPHAVIALLAGRGLDALQHGNGWKAFAWTSVGLAGIAGALVAVVKSRPEVFANWLAIDPATAAAAQRTVIGDGLISAVIALLGVGLGLAVGRGVLSPRRASLVASTVAVLDLARAAGGLNPQTAPSFFDPLPGIAALRLDDLGGGRVFTYGVKHSPTMTALLAGHHAGIGVWAFAVNRQLLDPSTNVLDRVETAQSRDRTSFVRFPPHLLPGAYAPEAFPLILPVLRQSAVSRVLSLDSIDHPDLKLLARVPVGPAGLAIHAYALADPWPRAYVACRVVTAANPREALRRVLGEGFDAVRDVVLEGEAAAAGCVRGTARRLEWTPGRERYVVEVEGPGLLVTRDTHAQGWKAWVDGQAATVHRANYKHRAVSVPAGRHEVTLVYRPPGLEVGLVATAVALVLLVGLVIWPVPREASAAEVPAGPR